MKHTIVRYAACLSAAACLAGCRPTPKPKQARKNPPAKPQKSGARDVIDTMTQKNKIKAGLRAKAALEKVGAQEREDFNEVMGNQ